jgi:hypothetical protein
MAEISMLAPRGFSELSKAEQVRYLQALWNQISEQPEDIPVPQGHLQLAEERQDPSLAHPAFEVLDRIAGERRY